MTDQAFDAVTDGEATGVLGFWKLPGGFEGLLARWSVGGPVACVEAEYFGGVGEQRAAVRGGGSLALGPLETPARRGLRTLRQGASGRTGSRPSGWTGTVTPTTGSRPVRGDAGPARRLAPASQPSGLFRIALRWLNVSIE
ncbi:MAG: hypothetical protein HOV82_31520 [Streptomyces sp.]|nr:hypothetical protein [Streptomyces sp.]